MKKDLLILKMYAIKRRKNSHLANSAPFLSEKDPIQRCLEIRLQLTLFPWLFDTILSNISTNLANVDSDSYFHAYIFVYLPLFMLSILVHYLLLSCLFIRLLPSSSSYLSLCGLYFPIFTFIFSFRFHVSTLSPLFVYISNDLTVRQSCFLRKSRLLTHHKWHMD